MNFRHRPNQTLGMRSTLRSCCNQAFCQRPEIKSAIEAIGKSAKILFSVLAEAKAAVTATQAGLEFSQRRACAKG